MEATNRAARRTGKQAQYEEARRAQLRRAFEKRAPIQEPKKVVPQASPARPSVKQEMVKLKDGAKFVIIFSLPRRKVPQELQVLRQCGGQPVAVADGELTPQDVRFSKADVDLDGLMQRVSVDVINICQGERNFCRVYVNCTVGVGGKFQGFGPWTGEYEQFVRKNVEQVWSRAILKVGNDKTSFELRKPVEGMPETIIRFAIDRS